MTAGNNRKKFNQTNFISNKDIIDAVVISFQAIGSKPKKISGLQRDSNPWPLR